MATLRKGSDGTQVANLQRVLDALGFDCKADGDYGPKTLRVVKAFQRKHGLKPDGIVGRKTWAKLDKVFQPTVDNFTSSGELTKAQTKAAEAKIANPKSIRAHKRLKGVHPDLAAKVVQIIELARKEGYTVRVSQGVRTFAQQDALYAKGRTKKGPRVTGARGGRSWHNFGTACDLVFIVNGRASWDVSLYDKIGPWAKQVGGVEWGGSWRSFKDRPHLQLAGLPSTKKALATYNAAGKGQKGMNAVWDRYA